MITKQQIIQAFVNKEFLFYVEQDNKGTEIALLIPCTLVISKEGTLTELNAVMASGEGISVNEHEFCYLYTTEELQKKLNEPKIEF